MFAGCEVEVFDPADDVAACGGVGSLAVQAGVEGYVGDVQGGAG